MRPGRSHVIRWILFALPAIACASPRIDADDGKSRFFEAKVRPILIDRCQSCHGEKLQQSGLRMDSREKLIAGGKRGAAIVPGNPDASKIIQAIRYRDELKMPPTGKLPDAEIEILTEWVKTGAHWPGEAVRDTTAVTIRKVEDPERSRKAWAFQPVIKPRIPPVKNQSWIRSPIDLFVLSQLENKGLSPAPPAEKRSLIRRATFDLIGLPPTPEEVDAFIADPSQNAFAKVVDRLLASPRYGERWGRHWLDVARYADSNGMDENLAYVNAFRYRDYVINAFNEDMPYDRFVREQLAGDILWEMQGSNHEETSPIVATGFLTLGPKMLAEDDPVKMQMDIVDEQIDTAGRTFMGLTLGCARCHDHKFDPILMSDYYALAGIFKSTKTMDHFRVVAQWHERMLGSREAIDRQVMHQKKIAATQAEIKKLTDGAKESKTEEIDRLQKQLGVLESELKPLPEAMAVEEGKAENVRIHLRGNHLTLGDEVPRQFPRIIAGDRQQSIDDKQSGRLQFAEWMTRPHHPLTSRVMVNRIWRWHFGEGLVRTPDNFGMLGDQPSNQPLLDWLAASFVESGWSIKAMHRFMMLSSTYQMSSMYSATAAMADPENHLHWRMDRRRLDAEEIRDAILSASGSLNFTMGGTLLESKNREYVTSTASRSYDKYGVPRRSVYMPVIRSALYDVFQAFDFADPSVPNGDRETTTIATQSLFMMNSRLMTEQTQAMATKLLDNQTMNESERIELLYRRAYGRMPTNVELIRAQNFLRQYEPALMKDVPDPKDRSSRTWQALCRVVLSTNEFVYVE